MLEEWPDGLQSALNGVEVVCETGWGAASHGIVRCAVAVLRSDNPIGCRGLAPTPHLPSVVEDVYARVGGRGDEQVYGTLQVVELWDLFEPKSAPV